MTKKIRVTFENRCSFCPIGEFDEFKVKPFEHITNQENILKLLKDMASVNIDEDSEDSLSMTIPRVFFDSVIESRKLLQELQA